jgi:transposase
MARRKFTKEFKLEAVRLVTERGVAVAQAARDLDLAESVLRRWMREAAEGPITAFPGNGQQRAELAEIAALEKEVAKLKAERDIQKRPRHSSRGSEGMTAIGPKEYPNT